MHIEGQMHIPAVALNSKYARATPTSDLSISTFFILIIVITNVNIMVISVPIVHPGLAHTSSPAEGATLTFFSSLPLHQESLF